MNAAREWVIPADDLEATRPLSNDERMAGWASKYFLAGHHRRPRNTSALTPTAIKAESPGFDDSHRDAAHGSENAATFDTGDGAGIQGLPPPDFSNRSTI